MKHGPLWISVLSTWLILCFPIVAIGGETSEEIGDAVQILLPAIAFGMTYLQDDSAGRLQFTQSFVATIGLTHGLKRTINRTRPNGGSFSFPAGHVSAAFSGAAFLEKRYGWRVSLPAYIGAAYVGWSRIDSDQHFTEDVLTGAAIGIATTYYFTRPQEDIILHTAFSKTFYGLIVEKRW